MASMAKPASTATTAPSSSIGRFELLEILSDVACDEASRLSPSTTYPDSNKHLTSLSPPSTNRSSSSTTTGRSLPQTQTPFPAFQLYTSAYVGRAPHCEVPLAVMRRVIGVGGAPRLGGVRKPVRTTVAPPITGNVGGWKGRSTPSRFCHICSRTAKKVELLACANLASGACRKVVCEKCFAEYKWNWKAAEKNRATWQCTHCRRVCPRRAQCAIYRRTNERRREQQQAARARLQSVRALHSDNNAVQAATPRASLLFAPSRIAPNTGGATVNGAGRQEN